MRIAICVYDLYNGGAERVASLWANGFVSKGDEVTLITCAKSPHMDYFLSPNVQIENIWSDGKSHLRYIGKLCNLRKVLKRIKPNVALAVLNPFDLMLPFAAFGLGVVCINTEHNSFERPDSAPMSKGTRFRKFYFNRIFKAITVLTVSDKKVIGNRLKNVFVIPNPVTFEPLAEIPPKEKFVLATGRLDTWHVKGFDILIDAWAQVYPQHQDWELRIAGRGRKENELFLLEKAENKGLNKGFRLLGFCNNIQEQYKKSAIFAFPSRCDGFGMVLTEAMSQGCACISSDYLGRQSEIITSKDVGVLIPTNDVDALASSLEQLISDSNRRRTIQMGAMRRAKDYSIDSIIEKWYFVFDKLGILNNH